MPTYTTNIKQVLLKAIASSQYSIDVAVAYFNDSDLIAAITAKQKSGVRVRVLLGEWEKLDLDLFKEFTNQGGRVVVAKQDKGLMHIKLSIIDKEVAFLGSYNWTFISSYNNNEMLIETSIPDEVKTQSAHFENLWNENATIHSLENDVLVSLFSKHKLIMPYPSITAYLEAIQLPDSFKELVGIEPVLNSNNEPIIIAGGNAVVFKMRLQGKQVAIKCFTNDSEERTLRYEAISSYLQQNPTPYFVTFKYYETELFIDGEEYPVVLMDWVEGKTLGTSMLEAYRAKDRNFLRLQASKMLDMFLFLLHQPIAHGDLKHENILVKDNGELVLVDYDGMYIPSLAGKQSIELGSKGYQHPERNASWFDADLDNFSMLVMMLTHLYLAELPKNRVPESSGQLFTNVDFKVSKTSQIHACFQYKICRLWAAFLFDTIEDKSLLNAGKDFFRNMVLINEAMITPLLPKINLQIVTSVPKDLEIKVSKENSESIFKEGLSFLKGEGIAQDYSKAKKCFTKAAELGNIQALTNLGLLYKGGLGTTRNDKEAAKYFLKAANLNDRIGMFNIGLCYYTGDGVEFNYVNALKWFKKAAEFGDTKAINYVGFFYETGKGVIQNYKEAMYWYKKAAEFGDHEALNNIGDLYKNGLGVPQDYEVALEWYRKAKQLKKKY